MPAGSMTLLQRGRSQPGIWRRRRFRVRRKRYFRRGPRNVQVSRVHALQPNRLVVRMRYCFSDSEGHEIASSSGSMIQWRYRTNGPYDPYGGAGGSQPRGFDQWMSFYRRGVVLGSQCVVNFFFQDASATQNAMQVGIVMNDGSSISDKTYTYESPRSVHSVLTQNTDRQKLVKRYSYKIHGVRDPADNSDLTFTASADPTEQYSYHIYGFALNGATETCWFTGYIDYLCVLFDPITPVQS